jgi:hypothetical protein
MVNNIFAKIEYKLVFARIYRTFLRSLVKVFLIRTSQFSVVIREFPTIKLDLYTFLFPNFRIPFLLRSEALKNNTLSVEKTTQKKPNKTLKNQMSHLPSPGAGCIKQWLKLIIIKWKCHPIRSAYLRVNHYLTTK